MIHELGLNMRENRLTLIKARLDVLVFADMLSEPMSYFLGFSRFAPVQVCFWGNPLTTGRSSIDYFVSADRMEHPHRTWAGDEWSEQVVLLDGQGIWYRRPSIPEGLPYPDRGAAVAARQALGLPEGDWPLLLCPQSVFKLHPHFDSVIRRILEATTNARVVFTAGRRQAWTKVLVSRLEKTLGPYKSRCAFVPRQMPGTIANRIAVADVLLHPFPFGGSRTSADGLALGVPVVVRPTTQLRCRMAYSFYASMGLTSRNWTLVASTTNDYVAFAAKLANDVEHRRTVAAAVAARQHVIWEDRSVVLGWARFLARVAGQRPVAPADVGLEGHDDEADVGLIEENAAAIEAHERLDRLFRDDTIIEEKRRALRPQKPIPDMPSIQNQPRPPEALEAALLYERGDIRGAAAQLEALTERCFQIRHDCPDEAKVEATSAPSTTSHRWSSRCGAEEGRGVEPTTSSLNNLAVTLNTLGREDEADAVYERAYGP